jgi:hypothetical protein
MKLAFRQRAIWVTNASLPAYWRWVSLQTFSSNACLAIQLEQLPTSGLAATTCLAFIVCRSCILPS